MKTVAIIPARMGSTRFPGKPLAKILGLPMIEHVRRRVEKCPSVNEVIVATCDGEIFDVVSENGGKAVMTSDAHERCTDRIAEAALSLEADIVVNVQGDEPMVRPEMIETLLAPLSAESALQCSNLMSEIVNDNDFNSADVVKTVVDLEQNAVYFSREPIPSVRKSGGTRYGRYRQLGIIAFRKDFLHIFAALPPTPLEIIESVDMLRLVEHGHKIRMVLTDFKVMGVDTPADLERVCSLMRTDDMVGSYIDGGRSL